MGQGQTRHHVENKTSYNIYVKYDHYDIVTTGRSGEGSLSVGSGAENAPNSVSVGASGKGSVSYTIKDRPSGFNLILPNHTDECVTDSAASLSVIVVKDGKGYLVINN